MDAKRKRKARNGVTLAGARRIALALPETEERPSYGTPGFRVKGKLFARMHQDEESLVVRIETDEREALLEADPGTFFITPHYEKYPWIQVRLSRVEHEVLEDLLEDAWSLRAPPKLSDALSSRGRNRRPR